MTPASTILAEQQPLQPMDELQAILATQRAAFLAEQPVTLKTRRDRLDRGLAMILARRDELQAAALQDFDARGADWTLLAEIFAPVQVFLGARKSVHRWMRPEARKVPLPFSLFGAKARIEYQPLGVVGIMGAWNAPLNLVLVPLATVLAAGNRAMLCPSDLMPNLAAALDDAVKAYFDPAEIAVVRGGLEVSKRFAQLEFDHLMFTGSPAVGAKVMAAAAPNLVPVTLELGGKCPAIIAPNADLEDAAARLIDAKTLNGGQACLAPDLLLVPRSQLDAFVRALDVAAKQRYPAAVRDADYCGLLNDRHYQRLDSLIEQARQFGTRVETLGVHGDSGGDPGGERDAVRRRLAVHALIDPPMQSRAMSEELFGPVLVILSYDDPEAMCARLRAMPKPLGLYIFSRDAEFTHFVLGRTFSGGVTINDALFHYSIPDLPFGGVGRSGMGAYSFGIEGFRRFSHARAIYRQAGPRALLGVMQPPYGRLFDWVIRNRLDKLARRYAANPGEARP